MHQLDESLLAGVPAFQKLSPPQIREVLDQGRAERFARKSTIYEQGQPAERFFLLLDGHVRALRANEEGEQAIVLHVVGGQLFGIAKALGHDRYPATTIAADDCVTLSWPMRLWDEFIARYPGFSAETSRLVGMRVEEIHNRMMELATQQVEQRIASALLRLVRQTGKEVEGGIEINLPLTRENISDMTGSTLHTVSRTLSAWEKDGVIASTRGRIVVTNPHELVLLSEAASS